MQAKIESLKLIISTALAPIVSLFGATRLHMLVLIILMFIDTVFGWVASHKNGTWKSGNARWGSIGKIVEIILITAIYLINYLYNIEFLIYIIVYYFILCELASILENYALINQNLPEGLINILKAASQNAGKGIIAGIKKIFEKDKDTENKKEEITTEEGNNTEETITENTEEEKETTEEGNNTEETITENTEEEKTEITTEEESKDLKE